MHGVLRRSMVVLGVLSVALIAALYAAAGPPGGDYTVTPLVSDIPGAAPLTDPELVNAWGLARSATSPWWVADNGPDRGSSPFGQAMSWKRDMPVAKVAVAMNA